MRTFVGTVLCCVGVLSVVGCDFAVTLGNDAPVLATGGDQTVEFGSEVTIDLSGSSDPEGDSLGFSVTFLSVPEGSALTDDDLLVGASGKVTFTPDVAGIYSVDVRVSDGEIAQSGTVAITVVITETLPAPEVSGQTPTNDTSPTWTWTIPEGAVNIRYQIDNESSGGWTEIGGTGTTTFEPVHALSDGNHTLFVQAQYGADAWSGSGNFTIVVDTNPPTAPSTPDLDDSDDSGQSSSDNITNVTGDLGFSGTAEEGATVELYVDGSPEASTIAEEGRWIVEVSLLEGTHEISARATDAVGHRSAPSPVITVVVDLTPPSAAPSKPDLLPEDDTGISDSDDLTNKTVDLTFVGETETETEADSLVAMVIDGSTTEGVAAPDGTWTIEATLEEGEHTISATSLDLAGNQSPESAVLTVCVDTTAPPAPSVAGAGPTNDTTPVWTWTVSEDAVAARYQLNGEDISAWTLAAIPDQTSFSPAASLPDGDHTLYLQTQDAAGNWSASGSRTVTIDTVPPSAPTTPDLDASDDSGVADDDDITNVTEALSIAGTAEVAATVELFADGDSVGSATAENGTWSIDISLSDGLYELTATATDAAGNTSVASSILVLTIDTTAPETAPTQPDLAAEDDSGISDSDNVTKQTTGLTLSGSAETGEYIGIFGNGSLLAIAGVSDGMWVVDVSLAEGIHSIITRAIDAAGNRSAASQTLALTVDTTPPAAPGLSGTTPTNDTTPTWSWTIPSGAVDIRYQLGGEDAALWSTVGGTEETTHTPLTVLSEGDHTLYVQAEDSAGNWSDSGAKTITVDTTPPSAPSRPDLSASDDTGVSDNDDITSLTTGLSITGSAEAGSTVAISVGGTVVAAATATGGTWSVEISLSEGTHQVSVSATDAAGNQSAASTALSISVDTTAPAATPSMPDLAPSVDTGESDTDELTNRTNNLSFSGGVAAGEFVRVYAGSTALGHAPVTGGQWSIDVSLSEGSHAVSVKAMDAAGNESDASGSLSVVVDTTAPAAPSVSATTPTNDTTPTWTWNVPAGSVDLRHRLDSGSWVTVGGTGTVSFTPGTVLSEGSHTVEVQAVDGAGNWSVSGARTLVVDTTPPSAPSRPDLATADDSGRSLTDNITNKTSGLTFSGTAEAGAHVQVYSGATLRGTTTATGGSWSLDISLSEGVHSLVAKATDAAGNVSSSSSTLSLTIDTTPPGAAPSRPDLSAADDSGVSATDNVTNITSGLTFSGSGESGTYVDLYDGGSPVGNVPVSGGSWSLDVALASGGHSLYARATDLAGNASAVSATLSVTIDTSPPSTPAVTVPSLTNDTTPTWSWTVPSGAADLQHRLDGLSWTSTGGTSTTSYTPASGLADGSHTLYVRAGDTAGNWSSSGGDSVVIDTRAPAPPTTPDLAAADDSGGSALDNVTNRTTGLTFSGTSEAGAQVQVFADGTLRGGTTATGGTWSVDISLAEGTYSISAKAGDAAGNASSASAGLTLTIDTTAPPTPSTPLLDSADDSGPSSSDNVTSRTTGLSFSGSAQAGSNLQLLVNGTMVGGTNAASGSWGLDVSLSAGVYSMTARAIDLAGNVSPTSSALTVTVDTTAPSSPSVSGASPTSDTTPTWSWSIPSGSVDIQFRLDSGGWIVVGGTGQTSYAPASGLAEGAHTLYVAAMDLAGNWSTPGSAAIIVDLTPPAVPSTPDLAASDDTGASSSDNATSRTSGLTFSGTADSGDTVQLYVDEGLRSSTVSSGSWSIDLALSEGTYSITARAVDRNGLSSAASSALSVTVDTTAPTQPEVDGTNQWTARPMWLWSSSGSPMGYQYQLDGQDPGGWSYTESTSYTPGVDLPEGYHTVYVKAVDSAGNWSAVGSRTLNVDLPVTTGTITVVNSTDALQLVTIYNMSSGFSEPNVTIGAQSARDIEIDLGYSGERFQLEVTPGFFYYSDGYEILKLSTFRVSLDKGGTETLQIVP